MTDRPNNPDDLPEEDWAMSEPEVPINREPQPEPADETAAKLYSPPETGDLQDWDIATSGGKTFQSEPQPANYSDPPAFDGPTGFTRPQVAFEILKPLVTKSEGNDDWGMDGAVNDGWKMIEPVFRVSDGNSSFRIKKSPKPLENIKPNFEAVPEKLSELYAPPETGEFVDGEEKIENSVEVDLLPEEADFGDLPSNQVGEESPENAKPVRKKNRWSILLWILILGVFVLTLLAIGVFVVFFYSSRH